MATKAKSITATRIILAIIALVCLTGAWIFWQWNSTPAYWRNTQHDLFDHASELAAMADKIESQLITEVSGANTEGAVTTIRVSYSLANAWLRVKLPQWARNQGQAIPPPLNNFMIAENGSMPVIAFELKTPEVQQVISMRFSVSLRDDGLAAVKLDNFRAGQLSIPAESVLEYLGKKMPAYNIDPLRIFVQGEPFPTIVRHPGHQGRNLRLVGFAANKDALTLTVRAEPRQK